MKEKLLIIGASGHGKVVADIAIRMNKWLSIAFLDDDESKKVSIGGGVIGKVTDASKYINEADFIVAIGNNMARKIIQNKLIGKGASIVTLIHPSAIIGTGVELGSGTVIMAGVIINSCTKIGEGCIINTGSTLDHDDVIEDYVHISPGANLAGTVKVGKSSWVGIGSVISNNINIASNCKIGAGAVVIKDITESGTYIGIPARRV